MNIKDIAKLAGVSASTVSKVLNKNDRDISEATKEKVMEVVRENQYIPYSQIRRHTFVRSYILGVLVVEDNAYYRDLIYCLEKEASRKGYGVIIRHLTDDNVKIENMDPKAVDGVIFVGNPKKYKLYIEELQRKKIPLILCGWSEKDVLNLPAVIYDNEQAAYTAISYLIEKGHTHIGCMLEKNSCMGKGYQRALYEHGIEYDSNNIFTEDISTKEGQEQLNVWIKLKNTAVFCEDSKRAVYIYRQLMEKKIMIPDDVSIVAGKDSRYFSLLKPDVTALKNPVKEMAKKTVNRMLSMLENRQNEIPDDITTDDISPKIEERESVESPNKCQGQKLVVVGSLNLDISISVPFIPIGGEAMIATATTLLPGGKGANQAVGAAKLGGKVYMIGCLGNDSDGKELYTNLLRHKIKTDGITFENTIPTGKAYISIPANNDGDSTIIVYQGANKALSRSHIKRCEHLMDGAKYCLLSLEIPTETAAYTVSVCNRKGIDVILKPSGAENIGESILKGVAYLVPNKKELALLVPGEMTIEEKAQILCDMGVENVIVTLGKDGCYLKNKNYSRFFEAADFQSIDTTGGADAFISALAVYLSEGISLIPAIGFATYSAGITITRQGVQPSMPDRVALDMYQDDIAAIFKE